MKKIWKMSLKNRAVFLDRDGVINEDDGYVYKIEDFRFKEGIFKLLKYLQILGYRLFIVTNQSGIARGYYSKDDFLRLTEWMIKEFKKESVNIEKVYYCPHMPDSGCSCRKPKPGMIKEAVKEFDIDVSNSWMIGDKPSDMEAAKNAGIKNRICINDNICNDAKYSVKDILDIINIIK